MEGIALRNRGWFSSPLLSRSIFNLENEIIFRPKHDPDKPPPHEPGDGFVVAGMLIGALVLGAAGLVFAVATQLVGPYLGGIVGLVLGAVAGTIAGDRVRKSIIRRRQRSRDHARS